MKVSSGTGSAERVDRVGVAPRAERTGSQGRGAPAPGQSEREPGEKK